MRYSRAIGLFLVLLLPVSGYTQMQCKAPDLTDEQVHKTVVQERAARTDIPPAFPEYRWSVRRQGCHYVYIEYGLPETPDNNHIFWLNQHGVIVDVQSGGQAVDLQCPDKVFTESELAEIVAQAREKRDDLPPPFPRYKTRVDRLQCLYHYFEYALPEARGNYQVFTIDPFGELMYFSRSQPY